MGVDGDYEEDDDIEDFETLLGRAGEEEDIDDRKGYSAKKK